MPGLRGIRGLAGPPGAPGVKGAKGDREQFQPDFFQDLSNATMEKISSIEDWFNQTFTAAEVAMEGKFKRLSSRIKASEERPMIPGPKGEEGVAGPPVCR